ncbi:hypothetical protein DW975_15185, partial [Agathobacter rectalis]
KLIFLQTGKYGGSKLVPKITIIKIIHFTIDFLLAGFYMNDAKALGVFCISRALCMELCS